MKKIFIFTLVLIISSMINAQEIPTGTFLVSIKDRIVNPKKINLYNVSSYVFDMVLIVNRDKDVIKYKVGFLVDSSIFLFYENAVTIDKIIREMQDGNIYGFNVQGIKFHLKGINYYIDQFTILASVVNGDYVDSRIFELQGEGSGNIKIFIKKTNKSFVNINKVETEKYRYTLR